MHIEDMLRETVDGHTIELAPEEACVIDWVLTAHTWDSELIERLDTERYWAIREQVGRILVGHSKTMTLEEPDVRHLLILIPVLFAVGTAEVGSSVKTKLYECLVGKAPEPEPNPAPEPENYIEEGG